MLLFRYIKLDIDIPEQDFHYKKKEVKSIKESIKSRTTDLVSNDPERDIINLLNRLSGMKNIVERDKLKMMREWVLPESLKPVQLEPFPGTFVECCLYSDVLKIFYGYVKENKLNIGSSRTIMNKMMQTVIVIKDGLFILLTDDIYLRDLIKSKVKNYKKYGIKYSEEESEI